MARHDPRDYVLGQDLRVRILTAGPQTSGRHDLVDAFQLPDTLTPLHLHTRYEERHCTCTPGTVTPLHLHTRHPPRRRVSLSTCVWR